ncbi:PTS transporter subunit EIIB [Serratia rubidaea]|nr:PTS transporter subunit EIIB [Serratia rubidaea]
MTLVNLADVLLTAFGGAQNVDRLRYCASRIRVSLKEDGRLNRDGIAGLEGIKALLEVPDTHGGVEYQLVVGPGNARPLYQALSESAGRDY